MELKKTVTYKEFGAVGDGKTNDMAAIIKTHKYANENHCKVVADKDARYYIGYTDESAIIKTDVDFGNAEFIIDDTVPGIHKQRGVSIFNVVRQRPGIHYNAEDLAKVTDNTAVCAGDTCIPWLAKILPGKALVMIKNAEHNDYVRFGSNRNAGSARHEMIIVDKNGAVDAEVPVTFDYEKVTDVTVINVEDTPITVEGGKFRQICCRTCADTDFNNRYASYGRNLKIQRSNVTVKNLHHEMLDEPLHTGKQNESYPYAGFICIQTANNVKVIDCELTGHTTYYEDRSHIANYPSVPMGTYDLSMTNSTHLYFENVTQKEETLADQHYWGIMGSNYCKCFTFINCKLSRFDAHCGFWNTKIIDCVFGQSINVIGGGELYIENTRRIIGGAFINLRQDYGATFQGSIILKNCTLCGISAYNSTEPEKNKLDESKRIDPLYVVAASVSNGAASRDPSQNYYEWDFGYTCYMPQRMYIENFQCDADEVYVFTDVRDEHFCKADKRKEYQRPKKIVLKNCNSNLKICPNKEGICNLLAAVPVEKE